MGTECRNSTNDENAIHFFENFGQNDNLCLTNPCFCVMIVVKYMVGGTTILGIVFSKIYS